MEGLGRATDLHLMQGRALEKFEEKRAPMQQIHEERLGLTGGPGGGRQPGEPTNPASHYDSFASERSSVPSEIDVPEAEAEPEQRHEARGSSRYARRTWRAVQPFAEAAGVVGGVGLVAGHMLVGGLGSALYHGARGAAGVYGNYIRDGVPAEEPEERPNPIRALRPPQTRPPESTPGGRDGPPVPAYLLDREEAHAGQRVNLGRGEFMQREIARRQNLADVQRETREREREVQERARETLRRHGMGP